MNRFILGIGGHKCASTWLSELLRSHPMVEMSNPKEIHFFTKRFEKGNRWYFDHFKNVDLIPAEFSSDYLYSKECVERAHATLPNHTKIIASIRNPKDRAISHIRHLARNDQSIKSNIDLKSLKAILCKYNEIEIYSKYYNGLLRYIDKFGKNNVHIIFFHNLKNNAEHTATKLLNFLEIPSFNFKKNLKTNESPAFNPKYFYLEKVRNKIFYWSYNNMPILINYFKKTGLSSFYRKINNKKQIEFNQESIAYLENIFKEDWNKCLTHFNDEINK